MIDIPAAARLYFRPTAFVAAPFDRDGQVLRLAGGMLWFAAFDVIAVDGGRRVADRLVPVERLDGFIAGLSEVQAMAARATIARITSPRVALQLGERIVRLDQPQVMAILNMTPDSFSDGGKHGDDPAAAADAGVAMAALGAAIIDVGGESTRPKAATIWEGDEIARTAPVIERLARSGTAIAIDTRKAGVMEAALSAGAHIVNDVSALLWDDRSAEVVAKAGCPIVLMHHQGDPQTMQDDPRYADALIEVYDWLEARIAAAEAAGIARDRIIVDPGIGFGKAVRHNLAILNGLALFHGLGCPILLGASRKRLIGALADEAPVDRRLGGSLALALAGANAGVQLIRVHDVAETVQALKIWRGMRDEALSPV
ncbi:dihydropteroate synthase [Sphingomonas sp. KC8]|uniref:dihydropteroate synthase n=1 Tax=Sphingomonas sp. KC8 TaxID=1030157 RepID=UPI0002489387|nr:dihydropteroate synthase [Sphingomonas sp. KC8]ARS29039.1 dihydropteroate synthase [Sphingomonas sp. KC8]